MRKLIFILFLFIFSFTNICQTTGQSARLESEYKLDVQKEDVAPLWDFIESNYCVQEIVLDGMKLSGEASEEIFIDNYFDVEDGRFAEMEISLRYRKRFKDDVLLKELVQLKTPFSEDKVVRNEIKFDVKSNKNFNDLSNRHPFLKLLSGSDKERMSHHLAAYKVRPEQVQESLKLKQKRRRAYIKDERGESVATITLDEVNNFSFPYQKYAEVELELNELRYTAADEAEREKMNLLNQNIKSKLSQNFPSLKVDQRSKYRKMKILIDESKWSFLYENGMWLFFGLIVGGSSLLFIKDQFI